MAKKSLEALALDVIAQIMQDPAASVAERLKAAAILLERTPARAESAPKWARLDDFRDELEELLHAGP